MNHHTSFSFWNNIIWVPTCALLAVITAQMVGYSFDSGISYRALIGTYITLGTVAGIVMAIASDRIYQAESWLYAIGILIRYYAGFYMITSGYAKIDDSFFDLSLSTYNQVLIDTSPKDLVWSFYGHSYGYQAIIGLIEIIGSALIFFRNTSVLGSCMLMIILINASLINYYYSLERGIWTWSMLALASYPILQALPRVFHFFIQNKVIHARAYPMFNQRKLYNAMGILKLIIILGPIVMYMWQMERVAKWTRHNYDHPAVGAWIIDNIEYTTAVDSTKSIPQIEKILLNKGRRGQLITTDTTSGFEYIVDTLYDQFEMYNFYEYRDMDVKGKYIIQSADTLMFNGRNLKDSLRFRMIRDKRFEERIRK